MSICFASASTLCVSDRQLRWFVFYFRRRFLDAVHLIHSNRSFITENNPNSWFFSVCQIPLFIKPFQVIIMMWCWYIWCKSCVVDVCALARIVCFLRRNAFKFSHSAPSHNLDHAVLCLGYEPKNVLFLMYASWSRIQLNHFNRNMNSRERAYKLLTNCLQSLCGFFFHVLFIFFFFFAFHTIAWKLLKMKWMFSWQNQRMKAIRLPFHRVNHLVHVNTEHTYLKRTCDYETGVSDLNSIHANNYT